MYTNLQNLISSSPHPFPKDTTEEDRGQGSPCDSSKYVKEEI